MRGTRTRRYPLVLIGQSPGNHARHDPERHALFPHPQGCSGHRLMTMMGLSVAEYISIRRRNVFPQEPAGGRFPMGQARTNAAALMPALLGAHVVFMGRKTLSAFGLDGHSLEAPCEYCTWHDRADLSWAVIPHPSGRNRWYNEPGNTERVVDFFREPASDARDQFALRRASHEARR